MMELEQLIAAVPDIGDKLAREMTIARIAHERGAAAERERRRDDRAAAVAATRTLFRAALLQEAAKWTGDFRVPAHKALCDAAKLAGVPLTLDECYLATKRA